MKFTTKQRMVLEAARDGKCLAGKASFRSKRDFNVTIDFEAGYFNAQFDRLEELGLVALGRHVDGVWGPRFVSLTAAGQQALQGDAPATEPEIQPEPVAVEYDRFAGEPATPKLTAAQSASLALVAAGKVSYSPGRTGGASSNWTRYSYHAQIGGKFAKRTKSVDALVNLGLADLTGSAGSACPVALTEAGRKLMGVQATPITASRALRGARILLDDGTSALVSDYFAENGKHVFRLRLSGGLYVNHYVDPFGTVAVLS